MQTVELLVSLKIPDVTALTAGLALRRRMGYDDVLKELRRSDYYSLDLQVDDPAAAQQLAANFSGELAGPEILGTYADQGHFQVLFAGRVQHPHYLLVAAHDVD